MSRAFNFNAGPAALPVSVLRECAAEMLSYADSGMSLMELSHRSPHFETVIKRAATDIRALLDIPSDFHVLFMSGGGTAQFSAVPLNLLGGSDGASSGCGAYIINGAWSLAAATEAAKFGRVHRVGGSERGPFVGLPDFDDAALPSDTRYVHYCHNETVNGVEYRATPRTRFPLVADMSSCIMTETFDVRQYALIYAGAQKNIGAAGVTVVIINERFLRGACAACPAVLNYTVFADSHSLYHTPPTYAIYVCGLVCQWIVTVRRRGGDESAFGVEVAGVVCGHRRLRRLLLRAGASRLPEPHQRGLHVTERGIDFDIHCGVRRASYRRRIGSPLRRRMSCFLV